MSEYPDQVLDRLRDMLPDGVEVEIPPKVFLDMRGEIRHFVEDESMTCAFPCLERYATPVGVVQGGIIAAAIDNTYGPFSFAVMKRPCVTLNMNVYYLAPFMADGTSEMVVEARIVSRGKKILSLEAQVLGASGATAVTSTTTMMAV